jgi:hypothetical protein
MVSFPVAPRLQGGEQEDGMDAALEAGSVSITMIDR